MTEITPERLAEIQDRVECASKGPWTHDVIEFRNHLSNAVKVPLTDHSGTELVVIAHTGYGLGAPHRNASFMAHARDDVPDLLAEVHRLRDELSRQERVAASEEMRLRRKKAALLVELDATYRKHGEAGIEQHHLDAAQADLTAALGGGDDA